MNYFKHIIVFAIVALVSLPHGSDSKKEKGNSKKEEGNSNKEEGSSKTEKQVSKEAENSASKATPAFVAVKRCGFPLTFRAQVKPGFKCVDSGGIDENDEIFTACKVLVGDITLLGKGYPWSHKVNGVQVVDNCWVVAPNGSEVTVHSGEKVTYLQTRMDDNVVVWANIKNFPDFPNITPSPISSKTGKLANSTKQYVARCKHEDEDGHHHLIPGVINDDDVTKAIITYAGKVITCEDFDVPVCI